MENLNFDAILHELNVRTKDTLMGTLEIRYTAIGNTYLEAVMPVNSRVHQPYGYLHGGASMALAESVASAASHVFAEPNKKVLGLEFSANHLKTIREGQVTARAEIVHKGKTTHLWQIRITDQDNQLISLCKLTNIVLDIK
ncbi:MAG: PaaI family thioesterase [Cryomorphaceae bacterium]|nr:PaaI family thioesterase [Cryomorphaceae bacterium]